MSITDEQIRELYDHHSALDAEIWNAAPADRKPGHNRHTGVMIACAVALGILSEAYPGARADARERCAIAYAEL